mmetsp:Transcript_40095/g.66528  ORF Transcript_40095/g.66528 Transcript_40095/m.66528 type:complete len:148 (-) Transcript_40095:399-842(-)
MLPQQQKKKQRSNTVVRTITLDAWAEANLAGKVPWIVKIDVEGSAGVVLRHAAILLGRAKYWFIGIHNRDEWRTVRTLFNTNEYTILSSKKRSNSTNPNGLLAARLKGAPSAIPKGGHTLASLSPSWRGALDFYALKRVEGRNRWKP